MKNIYKITRGQLITIWIFGLIGFFTSAEQSSYSDLATFLAILIPALLVFYTIGWRAFNKTKEENNNQDFRISNFLPTKRTLIRSILLSVLIIALVFGIFYFVNAKKENLRKEKLRQEYNQVILKIDSLKEEVASCIKPFTDKKYQEEVRSCNLLKNKIKADYDFCLTYTSVSPRASCLYDHDYESIDCSQETLEKKSRSKITEYDIPLSCRLKVDELKEVNSTIEEYSKLNKE